MITAYALLFASAFLAATILPFYSEITLTALIFQGYSPTGLWSVATVGNTLGAVVNWVIGRYLLTYSDHKWFPVSTERLQKSQRWFKRYGKWSLLLAWLPVGGDALTVVAGTMKIPLHVLIILAGIGKGLRYIVVIVLTTRLVN